MLPLDSSCASQVAGDLKLLEAIIHTGASSAAYEILMGKNQEKMHETIRMRNRMTSALNSNKTDKFSELAAIFKKE